MTDQPVNDVEKWLKVISQYENEFKKWEGRTVKILKRYRDDTRSQTNNESARFNILWSNVQTLKPAVYARMPKASVSRRFGDDDPVGRVGSLLIERCLDYEIEHYTDFRSSMSNCVEDRFLGGRGIAWVRYEPHIVTQDEPQDGLQITEDLDSPEMEAGAAAGSLDQTAGAEVEPAERIAYECCPADYVYWKDFGHTPARTWEEVGQVWRWVYMTQDALKARFPEKWKTIPLDNAPEPLVRSSNPNKGADKAKICELWDKESGKVFWLSKGLPNVIEEVEDPLELENFFPCPKPLYATTTSDSLVPVPDFVLYQDQANELDILSDRIDGLVKALKVRGVYDASQPALQRLLTEGDNNTLIPVDKWGAFSEKNGLKGSIDIMPLNDFASCLLQCYQARADIKSQVYEITGISDIIRGSSVASETATAQEIKGQYAGLRLKAMQEAVALFASDLLRLKAQIICYKYQPETILAYAAADQLSEADQALIPQALDLIKNDPLKTFRIEVAADSLVQLDEQQTKKDRVEFLNAFSNFMREAVPAGQASPEMVPTLMAMVKFGVGGFKQARTIEGTIDQALEDLKAKAAQAAQNPPPNPEMQKLQAEQQARAAEAQADAQVEMQKMQAQGQIEAQKAQTLAQIEQIKQQHEDQREQLRMEHEQQMKAQELAMQEQFDRWKAELEAATKIMVARIGSDPTLDFPETEAIKSSAEQIMEAMGAKVDAVLEHVTQSNAVMSDMHNKTLEALGGVARNINAPKRIIRGSDGRAVGVEPIQMEQ